MLRSSYSILSGVTEIHNRIYKLLDWKNKFVLARTSTDTVNGEKLKEVLAHNNQSLTNLVVSTVLSDGSVRLVGSMYLVRKGDFKLYVLNTEEEKWRSITGFSQEKIIPIDKEEVRRIEEERAVVISDSDSKWFAGGLNVGDCVAKMKSAAGTNGGVKQLLKDDIILINDQSHETGMIRLEKWGIIQEGVELEFPVNRCTSEEEKMLARSLKGTIIRAKNEEKNDIEMIGLHVRGQNCSIYLMDHRYKWYRMMKIAGFDIPLSVDGLSSLVNVFPALLKAKDIVQENADKLNNNVC